MDLHSTRLTLVSISTGIGKLILVGFCLSFSITLFLWKFLLFILNLFCKNAVATDQPVI